MIKIAKTREEYDELDDTPNITFISFFKGNLYHQTIIHNHKNPRYYTSESPIGAVSSGKI